VVKHPISTFYRRRKNIKTTSVISHIITIHDERSHQLPPPVNV